MFAFELLGIVDPASYDCVYEGSADPEKAASELIQSLKADSFTVNYGATSSGRTDASLSAIIALSPKHVLEIGVGDTGITYEELQKAGKLHGFSVRGIELDPEHGSQADITRGDIFNPTEEMLALIKASDLIRTSNTMVPYYTRDFGRLFGIMGEYMQDARLLVTHCPCVVGQTGEEGFLYRKSENLELTHYLFNLVHANGGLFFGGNANYSVVREIACKFIHAPLKELGYDLKQTENYTVILIGEKTVAEAMQDVAGYHGLEMMGDMISVPISKLREYVFLP